MKNSEIPKVINSISNQERTEELEDNESGLEQRFNAVSSDRAREQVYSDFNQLARKIDSEINVMKKE